MEVKFSDGSSVVLKCLAGKPYKGMNPAFGYHCGNYDDITKCECRASLRKERENRIKTNGG